MLVKFSSHLSRNWNRSFVITFGILGVVSLTNALSAETLVEAIATAYQSNAGLASAQAGLKATDELAAQAKASWLPTAKFFTSVDQEYKRISQSSTPGNTGSVQREGTKAGLEISQNIYKGGATEAAALQSEARIQATTSEYHKAEQDFLLSVIEAYLDVLKAQETLDLTLKIEAAFKAQLQQGKARFELGDLTLTDVSQIEAYLARATADRIRAEGDIDSAQAQYVSLIGRMPDHLSFPQAPNFLPSDKEQALDLALQKNPEYRKSQFDEKVSKEDITIALSDLRPDINLRVALQRDNRTDDWSPNSREYDAIATASLSLPLDVTGGSQSKVRAARQKAAQARLARLSTLNKVKSSVSKKLDALKTADAQISRYKEEVKATETARKGMALEEELGSRTMTDRLNAESEHFKAQISLIDARVKALMAHFELLAAIGDLTLARLDIPVSAYNPDTYLQEVSQAPYDLSIEENQSFGEEETQNITSALEKIN